MEKKKQDIITFKVDEAMAEALSDMPNRSEFIRMALKAALDGICPLCKGKGTLDAGQANFWESLPQDKKLEECKSCVAMQLMMAGQGAHDHKES
ncbi:MAG: ribbon-helix-helix domain-containing protein [Candidatus Sumerlaeia bacterium]